MSAGGFRLKPFPTEPLDLKVGDKVKFTGERQRYTVRAVTPRYVILTKPFNLRHTLLYCVIDWEESRRGPDNYYSLGYETPEQIEHARQRFAEGSAEVSVRHDVRLDLESVNGVVV